MSLSKAHALEIKEIVGAIYGLTVILEEDVCRDGSEGEESVLGRFETGCVNSAIKHLSTRAADLAEAIEEEEERLVGGGEL
ncbi:MAG: hypothetical protein ACQEXC_05805 [Pseudomonadota bacterium]